MRAPALGDALQGHRLQCGIVQKPPTCLRVNSGRTASSRDCQAGRRNQQQVLCSASVAEASATAGKASPPQQDNGAAALPIPSACGLRNNATSFAEEHRIRAYEVGPDQRTTIVTIANLLQEVAGNHGVALWGRTEEGFATDPIMVENNLIFVATRIQIRMDKYPKWGELVNIETWFQADGRIAFERNWVITNGQTGEQLGTGTSTWVMLDTEKRRPTRIPDAMRPKLAAHAPNPPRHTLSKQEAKQKLPEFPMPPEFAGATQVARRSDVDMNQHLNNVTYLAWCLEAVPMPVYTDYQLHQIEIDFKGECVAGDNVKSLGAYLDPADANCNGSGTKHLLHMLQRCDEDGCKELVRCRTAWRPAPISINKAEALGAGS